MATGGLWIGQHLWYEGPPQGDLVKAGGCILWWQWSRVKMIKMWVFSACSILGYHGAMGYPIFHWNLYRDSLLKHVETVPNPAAALGPMKIRSWVGVVCPLHLQADDSRVWNITGRSESVCLNLAYTFASSPIILHFGVPPTLGRARMSCRARKISPRHRRSTIMLAVWMPSTNCPGLRWVQNTLLYFEWSWPWQFFLT